MNRIFFHTTAKRDEIIEFVAKIKAREIAYIEDRKLLQLSVPNNYQFDEIHLYSTAESSEYYALEHNSKNYEIALLKRHDVRHMTDKEMTDYPLTQKISYKDEFDYKRVLTTQERVEARALDVAFAQYITNNSIQIDMKNLAEIMEDFYVYISRDPKGEKLWEATVQTVTKILIQSNETPK